MTNISKIKQLNAELYNSYHNNEPTTPQEILGKLGELKLAIKEVIKKNQCTWCESLNIKLKDELSKREYQISGLCQTCQDEMFKEK